MKKIKGNLQPLIHLIFLCLYPYQILGSNINWFMDVSSNASFPDGSIGNPFPNITSLLSYVSTQPNSNNYFVVVKPGTYDLTLTNYQLTRNVTLNATSKVFLRQSTIPPNNLTTSAFNVMGCTLIFNGWNIYQFRGPPIGYTFRFLASQKGTISFTNCNWNGDDNGIHPSTSTYYLNYNNTFAVFATDGSFLNLINCQLSKMRFLFAASFSTLLTVSQTTITMALPVYLNDSSALYYSIFNVNAGYANISNINYQLNCANLIQISFSTGIYINDITISYSFVELFLNPVCASVFESPLAPIIISDTNYFNISKLMQTGTAEGDEPASGLSVLSAINSQGTMNNIQLTDGKFQSMFSFSSVSITVTNLIAQNAQVDYIFNIATAGNITLENSLVDSVSGNNNGSVIVFAQYGSYFYFKNSIISNNQFGFSTSYYSSVTIVQDCIITGNQNIFMEIWASSQFYMYGTLFEDSVCVSTKTCLTNAFVVYIESSTFHGITGTLLVSEVANVQTTISITNTTFSNCSFENMIYEGTVTGMTNITLVNSLFEYHPTPLFQVNGLSWIKVYNTTFQFLQQQAIIVSGANSYAIIDTCRFTDNVIINSQDLITGPGGTAIWSFGTAPFSLLVNNSFFARNEAAKSYGGCIAFQNLTSNFSAVVMNSEFINNTALVGGAIYSDSVINFVKLVNATFTGNTAVQHGPNIATTRKISQIVSIPGQNSTGRPNYVSIYSGDTLPSVSVMEYDAYGQVLAPGLLNARFAMLDVTNNNGYNDVISGDTQRILMTTETTFVAVTIVGDAPPPITLNSNQVNNRSAVPAYFEYNLTLYEIDIRGVIIQVLDYIPLQIPRCSQILKRKQISSNSGIPRCIPITCEYGCVQGQGDCFDIDVCTCRPGYEGIACQMIKGNEDCIGLVFEVNGNITDVVIITEIINVLTAKYDLGSNKFVYRSLQYNPEVSNILYTNISVQDQNQVFVEGAMLQAISSKIQKNTFGTNYLQLIGAEYIESSKGYLHPGDGGVTFLYVFDSFAIILSCVFAVLLWLNRTHRMIKNILPLIAIFMIVGLLFVQIGVLFYIGLPTQTSCVLRKVFIDIGFTIFFGCAAMKSFRLYRIFKTMSKYSDVKLIAQIAGISSIPLIIIIITFIISSHPLVPVVLESNNIRYWVCTASSSAVDDIFNLLTFIFECILLVFSLLLSIANRQCWATFSETITLSLSIYITVFLALISYVIEQIGSSEETILYTLTFMYTGGSILLLLTLFLPRLLSVRNNSQASEESVKTASIVSKMEVHIPLFEDVVEMKISDGWATFLGTGWKSHPTIISESGMLYLPDYKNRAHILSKMMLLDRSKVVPFSLQLVGRKSVYWIKCKDENHFYLWMAILLKQCKQTDENFADNI